MKGSLRSIEPVLVRSGVTATEPLAVGEASSFHSLAPNRATYTAFLCVYIYICIYMYIYIHKNYAYSYPHS